MSDYASRFNVQGKRALVTGASRGIGAEIATLLADAGADVGIVGRDVGGLEATRQAIASKGRRCVVIQADLRTVEGPRIAGAQALEFFGTVDILVNNAGVFHRQSLLETTVEQWEETQAVDLRAPFLLAQVIVPGMIKQHSGKVINVSSLASVVGCEGHAGYSTDMGKQVWSDEAKSAPVKARIPLQRFGTPIEIAELVLYLASPASDFICGQVVRIDGGYSAV
jgi:NAD(P)-dependent dehydrogenase (short-subunit alcohol dehydrogenase family)